MSKDNRSFSVAWEESSTWKKVLFIIGVLNVTNVFYWVIIGLAYLIHNEGQPFFAEAWFRRTTYFGWFTIIMFILGILAVIALFALLIPVGVIVASAS